MNLLVGNSLIGVGIGLSVFCVRFINKNWGSYYGYPYTPGSNIIIPMLLIGICCLIAGITVNILSYFKSRNDTKLHELTNITNGVKKGTCSNCGTNLAESACICPACGKEIDKT